MFLILCMMLDTYKASSAMYMLPKILVCGWQEVKRSDFGQKFVLVQQKLKKGFTYNIFDIVHVCTSYKGSSAVYMVCYQFKLLSPFRDPGQFAQMLGQKSGFSQVS